jgi:hypothetical protein
VYSFGFDLLILWLVNSGFNTYSVYIVPIYTAETAPNASPYVLKKEIIYRRNGILQLTAGMSR